MSLFTRAPTAGPHASPAPPPHRNPQGAKSGNVRFDTAAQAQAALGRAEDGKLMVAGYSATLRILEGEDEETFLKVRPCRPSAPPPYAPSSRTHKHTRRTNKKQKSGRNRGNKKG